jgi:hypothetical protein
MLLKLQLTFMRPHGEVSQKSHFHTLIFENGSIPGRGKRIFPLVSVSRPVLGPTQPPVEWVPGVLSPVGKTRPGRDADYSPPSSAEVMSE